MQLQHLLCRRRDTYQWYPKSMQGLQQLLALRLRMYACTDCLSLIRMYACTHCLSLKLTAQVPLPNDLSRSEVLLGQPMRHDCFVLTSNFY